MYNNMSLHIIYMYIYIVYILYIYIHTCSTTQWLLSSSITNHIRFLGKSAHTHTHKIIYLFWFVFEDFTSTSQIFLLRCFVTEGREGGREGGEWERESKTCLTMRGRTIRHIHLYIRNCIPHGTCTIAIIVITAQSKRYMEELL